MKPLKTPPTKVARKRRVGPRTVVLTFMPKFAPKVESGEKLCTIRPKRKRPVRPGDRASLREWTGKPYRSKQRLLRESTVTKVTPFLISYSYMALDGKELSFAASEKLAVADGFDNARDLINWFLCTHSLPFEADLIEWSDPIQMSTAPNNLPPAVAMPASAQSPGSPAGRDYRKYVEEVRLRWSGECLANAKGNWHLFEEHHDNLVELIRPYLRDCWCEDLAGKMHNPDGTLTSWLWVCTNANGWLYDFCNHYQKCFLRRGLIAYAKQLIGEFQFNPMKHSAD